MSNTRNDVDWLINRFFSPGRSVKHAASSLEYEAWQQLGPSGHTQGSILNPFRHHKRPARLGSGKNCLLRSLEAHLRAFVLSKHKFKQI